MENVADALSVGLIGLFLCLTVRRTGTLWFAIGFHFAFDFAALSLLGAPNTGNMGKAAEGHLLVIALLFALFHFRHRQVRFPIPRS